MYSKKKWKGFHSSKLYCVIKIVENSSWKHFECAYFQVFDHIHAYFAEFMYMHIRSLHMSSSHAWAEQIHNQPYIEINTDGSENFFVGQFSHKIWYNCKYPKMREKIFIALTLLLQIIVVTSFSGKLHIFTYSHKWIGDELALNAPQKVTNSRKLNVLNLQINSWVGKISNRTEFKYFSWKISTRTESEYFA